MRDELGLALVLIAHDLVVVAGVADEVVVIVDGQVVEHAAREQLFSAPQDAYPRRLIAAMPRLDGPRALVPALDAAPLVELIDVSRRFDAAGERFRSGHGTVKAVDGVTLEIQPGEGLGLVVGSDAASARWRASPPGSCSPAQGPCAGTDVTWPHCRVARSAYYVATSSSSFRTRRRR